MDIVAQQTSMFDYGALDTETRIVVQQRTSEIKALMKRAASDIIEIGQKLIEVKARLGHDNWTPWLKTEFDWTDQTARNFMHVARAFANQNQKIFDFAPSALYLLAAPSTPEPARIEAIERAEAGEAISYSDARAIVEEHREQRRECPYCGCEYRATPTNGVTTCPSCEQLHAYSGPRDTATYGPYQFDWERQEAQRHVDDGNRLEVISGLEPRRAPANFTSDSNEWYTPAAYVEAARDVMGGIDVDPASNDTAQLTIRAGVHYTEETNGFDKRWAGRVWLNPPYGIDAGESAAGAWAQRLIDQYDAGITTEAVLLVNAVTERKWFQPLWRFPICFTDHRIKFYTPDGTPQQPINGNALVYLGRNVQRFARVFSQFGAVVARVEVDDAGA